VRYFLALVLAGVLLVFASGIWNVSAREYQTPWAAPELPGNAENAWINSEPLSLSDLQGKVVLLDFWTFGCWNCYRSFPWLNDLEKRLADKDFVVIGVHTPEFEHEKDRSRVVEKIKEFQLTHPVVMDNDFAFWKAMGNRYWPAFYLIDKVGRVRAMYVGEIHVGDKNARAIEEHINKLLSESV
jgi:thiol-disulfide isomerase/thioredoxin